MQQFEMGTAHKAGERHGCRAPFNSFDSVSCVLLALLHAVGGSGFSFHSDRPLLTAGSAAASPDSKLVGPAAVAGVAAAPPPPSQQTTQGQAGSSAVKYSDQFYHPSSSPDNRQVEGALGVPAGRRGGRPQLAVLQPTISSISGGEAQSSSEGGPEVSLNGGIASQVRIP